VKPWCSMGCKPSWVSNLTRYHECCWNVGTTTTGYLFRRQRTSSRAGELAESQEDEVAAADHKSDQSTVGSAVGSICDEISAHGGRVRKPSSPTHDYFVRGWDSADSRKENTENIQRSWKKLGDEK